MYLSFFLPVAEGLKFMLEVEDDQDWLQSDTTEDDEDSTRWAGQPFFLFRVQWLCKRRTFIKGGSSYVVHGCVRYSCIYALRMSPALTEVLHNSTLNALTQSKYMYATE